MDKEEKYIPETGTGRDDLPDFVLSEPARILLRSIEDILADLINRPELKPSDDEFYSAWRRLLDLYDRFQNEVMKASGINIVCHAGCSTCCFHWVEDVYSFEAIMISRYIAYHFPASIMEITGSFRDDADALNSLRKFVDEKAMEYPDEVPDPYELLLSCFYQLERPCALLDAAGSCSIYPVRPLTCRDYLNLRDPDACLPDRINTEDPGTFILYLSDTASERLEQLHRRFDAFNDNRSLRNLLVFLLDNPGDRDIHS